MTITAGKLRGLTQPTVILRIEKPVPLAPGEGDGTAYGPGQYVFAQYIGNGRLLLTPLTDNGTGPVVAMASKLNDVTSIVAGHDVVEGLDKGLGFAHHHDGPDLGPHWG